MKKAVLEGTGIDLGNGHAVIEYIAPWGRPVANWTAAWEEEDQAEINELKNKLVERFGEERAERIAGL